MSRLDVRVVSKHHCVHVQRMLHVYTERKTTREHSAAWFRVITSSSSKASYRLLNEGGTLAFLEDGGALAMGLSMGGLWPIMIGLCKYRPLSSRHGKV